MFTIPPNYLWIYINVLIGIGVLQHEQELSGHLGSGEFVPPHTTYSTVLFVVAAEVLNS